MGLQQCPYTDTMERRNDEEVFKIFFSVVVILYFSATMFYCFVAGTPEAGKGAAIYIMSAAGLSILFQRLPVDAFTTLFTSEKTG